jgi:hypothetical protein
MLQQVQQQQQQDVCTDASLVARLLSFVRFESVGELCRVCSAWNRASRTMDLTHAPRTFVAASLRKFELLARSPLVCRAATTLRTPAYALHGERSPHVLARPYSVVFDSFARLASLHTLHLGAMFTAPSVYGMVLLSLATNKTITALHRVVVGFGEHEIGAAQVAAALESATSLRWVGLCVERKRNAYAKLDEAAMRINNRPGRTARFVLEYDSILWSSGALPDPLPPLYASKARSPPRDSPARKLYTDVTRCVFSFLTLGEVATLAVRVSRAWRDACGGNDNWSVSPARDGRVRVHVYSNCALAALSRSSVARGCVHSLIFVRGRVSACTEQYLHLFRKLESVYIVGSGCAQVASSADGGGEGEFAHMDAPVLVAGMLARQPRIRRNVVGIGLREVVGVYEVGWHHDDDVYMVDAREVCSGRASREYGTQSRMYRMWTMTPQSRCNAHATGVCVCVCASPA